MFHLLLAAVAAVALSPILPAQGASAEQNAESHIRRGESLLKQKLYEKAEREFRGAIELDPSSAAAYYGLAKAAEGLERPVEVISALRRAIEHDPDHLDARTKLGNYYLIFSRASNADGREYLDDAERLAGEVLARDADHIEGRILLANVRFLQGDKVAALAELNRAVALDPRRIETRISLARFYASAGDAAAAEETYKRAIATDDSSVLARMDYGRFLMRMNRSDDAEREFVEAAEIEPQNRDARSALAALRSRRNDRTKESGDPSRPRRKKAQ